MKVVSYLKTVPGKNSNQQKEDLLRFFVEGAKKYGDDGVVHDKASIMPADVAVIQGWVHENFSTPHLKLRKDIIERQQKLKKYTVAADANLFLYANSSNPHGYLRYSFNGIFPSTGIYCDNNPNPARWQQIQKDIGIRMQREVRNGSHILLMLQRQGGWSMGGDDVEQWAVRNIKRIRQYSDRPIIIRPHPGDKNTKVYLNPKVTRLNKFQNVKINLKKSSLNEDLRNAWAVVNHNSSSIVGPIIMGYPAFVTDVTNSQCAEVAHTDYSEIENPRHFDRQKWLERISMFHWKFSELQDGNCWVHMRNYCQ